MARKVNAGLPPGSASPLTTYIVKVEYDPGEPKLRASLAEKIPTLPERQILVYLALECFQGELGAEYAANRTSENHSLGHAKLVVSKVLQLQA
jgi:hypothetical protein